MFLGEFEYRVDEKGRVPLPPKFRREFKDGLVLTAGPEKCAVAYPVAAWEKLAASLNAGTIPASKMRRLHRAIFATAFSLYADGQGRIALPVPLRDYAGIENEVVFAGANNCVELWSKVRWEAEKAASMDQAWQIIESLERH